MLWPQTETVSVGIIDRCQHLHGIDESIISQGSFQRRYRLTNANDYERVFRQNQRSVDDLFTVLYRRNGLGYPRLGTAIAKKQVRSAVARNRLKRLIRESFRLSKQQLDGIDIVIMARRNAGTSATKAIHTSLAGHWQTLAGGERNGTDGSQ